jgi:hypothetical protein
MKMLTTFFTLILALCLNAQNSVGFYITPNFQFSTLGNSPTIIADSLNAIKENDRILSYSFEFRKQIDRDQAFSFNPGFFQTSTLFVKRDLQLFDVIHPSLPEIRDQAQASSKVANLHYRFKYLSAQFQYSRRFKTPYKANAPSFEYYGALTYLHLIGQDIKLQTEGFAFQGDFTHIIKDSLYFTGRSHNLMTSLGVEVVYPATSDLFVFAGGAMHLPLLTINDNEPTIKTIAPGLKIGLRFEL